MKWISVNDETPDQPGMYLCHFTDGTIETFPLEETDFDVDGEAVLPWGVHSDCVTHWMPLPEPPEAAA